MLIKSTTRSQPVALKSSLVLVVQQNLQASEIIKMIVKEKNASAVAQMFIHLDYAALVGTFKWPVLNTLLTTLGFCICLR